MGRGRQEKPARKLYAQNRRQRVLVCGFSGLFVASIQLANVLVLGACTYGRTVEAVTMSQK